MPPALRWGIASLMVFCSGVLVVAFASLGGVLDAPSLRWGLLLSGIRPCASLGGSFAGGLLRFVGWGAFSGRDRDL